MRLENAKGELLSDDAKVSGVEAGWKKFEHEFTATQTDNKARLALTLGSKGTVWLDFVSLFPVRLGRIVRMDCAPILRR